MPGARGRKTVRDEGQPRACFQQLERRGADAVGGRGGGAAEGCGYVQTTAKERRRMVKV